MSMFFIQLSVYCAGKAVFIDRQPIQTRLELLIGFCSWFGVCSFSQQIVQNTLNKYKRRSCDILRLVSYFQCLDSVPVKMMPRVPRRLKYFSAI